MIPTDENQVFLQITLFSILWSSHQKAVDFLRYDSRWGEPRQRSLLGFEWLPHQEGESFIFNIAYIQFEYDTLVGWGWWPWWYSPDREDW